jgi:putative endonuclease
MTLVAAIRRWLRPRPSAEHLKRGYLGERAARRYLTAHGLKFLCANFQSRRGEMDLVFRDDDCLVFVEVKTRSGRTWTRPAAAVNARKKRLLSLTALDYLRRLEQPRVKVRFDIVEVLVEDDRIREIRHLPATFNLTPPYRFG